MLNAKVIFESDTRENRTYTNIETVHTHSGTGKTILEYKDEQVELAGVEACRVTVA